MKNDKITFREYAEKMIEVFGDNAKVGLCFLVATAFKDIIVHKTNGFPLLGLFGPMATGKTEMARTIASSFINNPKALRIDVVTGLELIETVANKWNFIVHIDEYRNGIDVRKKESLKSIWHGSVYYRAKQKTVGCGVVICGQKMPTDFELFRRMLILPFPKVVFKKDDAQNFKDLLSIRDGRLTHLVADIMGHRGYFLVNFDTAFERAMTDIDPKRTREEPEYMILMNWSIVLSAFKCLESIIDLPMAYEEMLRICTNGYRNQISKLNK